MLTTNDSTNSDVFIDYSRRQQLQFMGSTGEDFGGNMSEGGIAPTNTTKKKVIEVPTIPAYVKMDTNQTAAGNGTALGIVGNKANKNVKDQT